MASGGEEIESEAIVIDIGTAHIKVGWVCMNCPSS